MRSEAEVFRGLTFMIDVVWVGFSLHRQSRRRRTPPADSVSTVPRLSKRTRPQLHVVSAIPASTCCRNVFRCQKLLLHDCVERFGAASVGQFAQADTCASCVRTKACAFSFPSPSAIQQLLSNNHLPSVVRRSTTLDQVPLRRCTGNVRVWVS